MKKLLLLAIPLMMVGCFELKSRQTVEKNLLDIDYRVFYTPNGCEYYVYENSHGGMPVHKQDCKKCTERRKQEIKELIEELKK